MTWTKNASFLIDQSHNNLVTVNDPDFEAFFRLLETRGYEVHHSDPSRKLSMKDLEGIRTFFIGVPQNAHYYQQELNIILEFVRKGGSLFICNRYGGDLIQKTNLNEMTSHFGIYSENTLIYGPNNVGLDTLPFFTHFSSSHMVTNVKKVVMGGACSLRLAKEAQMLVEMDRSGWAKIFNPNTYSWEADSSENSYPVVSYAIYGQGRVIVCGTPDFLHKNDLFGFSSLDNRTFCSNLLDWLMQPVAEMEVRDWMLQQLGTFSMEISRINALLQKISQTMHQMDRRVRDLEYKFYAVPDPILISDGLEKTSPIENIKRSDISKELPDNYSKNPEKTSK